MAGKEEYVPLAEQIKNMPHDKFINSVWKNLREEPPMPFGTTGAWQWMMLNLHMDDIYTFMLNEQEYFEIAKFAAKSWAKLEGHRVRADKLTPEHYYEVCKIMAQQGVFWAPDYNKLQQVNIGEGRNPVFDIIQIAWNSCEDAEYRKILNSNINDYLKRHYGFVMKTMSQHNDSINRNRIRES